MSRLSVFVLRQSLVKAKSFYVATEFGLRWGFYVATEYFQVTAEFDLDMRY